MRLEGRRGKLPSRWSRGRCGCPPTAATSPTACSRSYADRFAEGLRARGFALREEGRARVNNAVGYEIGVQAVSPGAARSTGATCCWRSDDDEAPGSCC